MGNPESSSKDATIRAAEGMADALKFQEQRVREFADALKFGPNSVANVVRDFEEQQQRIRLALQDNIEQGLTFGSWNIADVVRDFEASLSPVVAWQQEKERARVEFQNCIARAMTLGSESIADVIRDFEASIDPLAWWHQQHERARLAVTEEVARWSELPRISGLVDQFLHDLNDSTRANLRILASHGWYMDPEFSMAAPAQIADALSNGRIAEADQALIEFFRTRLDAIRQRLLEAFPHREAFLFKAIDAHERGEYELSVPVFLAQADGICFDCTKLMLFESKDKKPQVAAYVEGVTDAYMAALLSPLAEAHPISLTRQQRAPNFAGLNRHQVLHGESLTYNTETNSLKAVSLIGYLAWVFSKDSA